MNEDHRFIAFVCLFTMVTPNFVLGVVNLLDGNEIGWLLLASVVILGFIGYRIVKD